MLEVIKGDLFESGAQTLVNTVNTVGVMGKGVALEFRKRFPAMYEDYRDRCERGMVELGRPYLYRGETEPWVLNFPTKKHWRSVSQWDAIVSGLEYLEQRYREWGITSLAVPPLGCGNGQLEWQVVGPKLYHHLRRLEIPVKLYAPIDVPPEQLSLPLLGEGSGPFAQAPRVQETMRLNPAWVAIATIVDRVHQQPYRAPIGRVMLQKMAYFASEIGIPTGMDFQRGSFGPFARDLKPILTRLVNNGVLREQQEGSSFVVMPGDTYREAARLWEDQLSAWDGAIGRVVDLFLRLRGTREAEIAATVHFVANELELESGKPPSERDIFDAVREWKANRRNPPTDDEVAGAIRNLNMLGWLQAPISEDLPYPEDDEALYA